MVAATGLIKGKHWVDMNIENVVRTDDWKIKKKKD